MSTAEKLRRFLSRTRLEQGLLLESFVLLGLMRFAILVLPFRRIVRLLDLTDEALPPLPESIIVDKLSAISWAVQAAAAHTPWESVCLGQALAGIVMLRRRGIPGCIRLGVAKDASNPKTMAAHAWLSCGEIILTGAGGAERYAVISSYCCNPAKPLA